MTVYTLTEAEDKLATILEKATSEGEVQIRSDGGRLFVIKPDSRRSPLDVEGVDVNISKEEIVSIIRECRER